MTDGQGVLVFDSGAGVADVLNLKLQDDSYIRLEGCNTAFGDNILLNSLVIYFLSLRLEGTEHLGLAIFFGGSSSVGIGKTYKGGQVIGW